MRRPLQRRLAGVAGFLFYARWLVSPDVRDTKGEHKERVRTRDGKDWVYIPQRAKLDTKPPTYYDQLKEFTGIRADDSYWNSLDVNIGRGVLQRLERAKNSFFRRVKAGEKAGYPRWKCWQTKNDGTGDGKERR